MKITYDPEADALYIQLTSAKAEDSLDIEEGVTVDLDGEGHIIGIELLDASERMSPAELTNVSYKNLLLARSPRLTAASRGRKGSAVATRP